MSKFNLGSKLRVYDVIQFKPTNDLGIYAGKKDGVRYFEVISNNKTDGVEVNIKEYSPSNKNRFWGYRNMRVRLVKSSNGIKPTKEELDKLIVELYSI